MRRAILKAEACIYMHGISFGCSFFYIFRKKNPPHSHWMAKLRICYNINAMLVHRSFAVRTSVARRTLARAIRSPAISTYIHIYVRAIIVWIGCILSFLFLLLSSYIPSFLFVRRAVMLPPLLLLVGAAAAADFVMVCKEFFFSFFARHIRSDFLFAACAVAFEIHILCLYICMCSRGTMCLRAQMYLCRFFAILFIFNFNNRTVFQSVRKIKCAQMV